MESIVSKQSGCERAFQEQARIGRIVIAFTGVGIVLEISSTLVCYLSLHETPIDETMSLTAMVCFVCAALILVRRSVQNTRVTQCMIGAALMLLLSKSLDLTGSIKFFDTSLLFGHIARPHRIIEDVSFTAGSMLLLMGFMLSARQVYQAQLRLTLQNQALVRETKERARLATAIEQSADSIVITDPNGVIQYVNPAFEALTGYARNEVTGKTPRVLKSGKHDAQFYKNLWDTITRGETWRGHFIDKRKDGAFYEEDAVISCVRDDDGAIISYIASKHDVTAQAKLEKQLRQAQKMEALGSFAGRIAHDFNNILALMLGHCEMALHQLPETDPIRKHVQYMEKAGNRASQLVKQILAFSRQLEQERRPVAMHAVVKEVLDFLRVSLPLTIHLEESVTDCGAVLADPTQIHQVVMNLCTNACHALDGRPGAIEVLLEPVELGPDFVSDVGRIIPGRYVRLRVRDTGSGIDPAILPHIFDPYFTTKKPGEGTGLGLSTVHGIVAGYGGGLVVQSSVGQGTAFDVYLPRMNGVAQPLDPAPERLKPGNERILVVDDDAELAEMTHESLAQLGYVVTAFSSSQEALARFRERPDDFDIVITDQVMPEMTGSDLARALLGIRPDLPIILVTGFGQGITSEQASAIGIAAYLMKPVSNQILSRAIRRALKDPRLLSAVGKDNGHEHD